MTVVFVASFSLNVFHHPREGKEPIWFFRRDFLSNRCTMIVLNLIKKEMGSSPPSGAGVCFIWMSYTLSFFTGGAMSRKFVAVLAFCFSLAACASNEPRLIQADANNPDILLTSGLATQIEMPDEGRVVSVVVGNRDLVTAERDGDVVNLIANQGEGETNLIIRMRKSGGDIKVYQYRVTVQAR